MFTQALEDFRKAKTSLQSPTNPILYNQCCLYLQQAVVKTLQGYLTLSGGDINSVYTIVGLIETVRKSCPDCVVTSWVYDNRLLLDAWYYELQYPGNIEMSYEEITAILEKVQEFLSVNGLYEEVT